MLSAVKQKDHPAAPLLHCRGKQKTSDILQWLAVFHFSTPSILLNINGSGPRDHSTLYSMHHRDLILEHRADTILEKIYTLSPLGLEMACQFLPRAAKYPTSRMTLPPLTLRHGLALQHYVVQQNLDPSHLTIARSIELDAYKIPDAIHSDPKPYAIEIERTPKAARRVYLTFYSHLSTMMRTRLYEHVEFVFPSKTMKERCVRLFNEPEWPIYTVDHKTERYVVDGKTWKPVLNGVAVSEYFEFKIAKMP